MCRKPRAAYVAVDPIVGELIGHDPSSGIVDENVNPVRLLLDDVGCFHHLSPVAEITLQPDNLLRCCLSHFLFDRIDCFIYHFFGKGQDEDLRYVVRE